MPTLHQQSGVSRSTAAGVGPPIAAAVALLHRHGAAAAGYGLPFALVFYLALKGGSYDAVVRGEVGIAAWWLVLLGGVVGALPATRVTKWGWIALGLLAGFCLWTALGISWSDSSERSVTEATRVAMLLGVLALAIFAQGRDALRRTVCATGAAIALVAALALLSRLHPQWFPENEAAALLGSGYRLNYPLGYWNGLAALIAIGLPLVLWVATHAHRLATQALAAAVLPAMVLAGFYTFSRGGVGAAAIALALLLAMHPRRLSLLPTLFVATLGSAILVAGAVQRGALADGLSTPLARSQGDEMLAMGLVVCAGVGLVQVAIGLAARHRLGPRLHVPRRAARVALAASVAVVLAVAAVGDLPGYASERWEDFKGGGAVGSGVERFDSSSGNSRYQYWQAAADANATRPLAGIGPGTFEYWWAREATVPGFVRDAHSLYIETLAELGVVGLTLIGGLIVLVLVAGAARALRRGTGQRASLLAAATAAAAAFAAAAAVDWTWELTVLPVAFLLLAAAILGPSAESRWRSRSRFERRPLGAPARVGLGLLAGVAIVATAIPVATTTLVRDSQAAVNVGDLDAALADARRAGRAQPYAAAPKLQEALVLELRGDLDRALVAARAATDAETVDWRTWLVRSRLAARTGNGSEAVHALRRARSLNPRSRLLR